MSTPHTVRIPPEALRAAVEKVGLKPENAGAARYTNALMAAAPLIVAAYLEQLAREVEEDSMRWSGWLAADVLNARAGELRSALL